MFKVILLQKNAMTSLLPFSSITLSFTKELPQEVPYKVLTNL